MKSETLNSKLETNLKPKNQKRFDLEDRLQDFAREVRSFIKKLPKNASNREDIKQLVRSSGSIGANYLEANESLSKKDFIMRIKIAKKEARETIWWLELVETDKSTSEQCKLLQKEATELMNILGAIMRNSQ